MIKIHNIELKNYCGYRFLEKNFMEDCSTRTQKSAKNLTLFYGPNGCGKTSFLEAILMASNAFQFSFRDNDILFRKIIFNSDYNPNYPKMSVASDKMMISACFSTPDGIKKVVLSNNGIVINELQKLTNYAALWVDADNPMMNHKFQLETKYKDIFLELAEAIYGYRCEVPSGDLAK